ncbi:MAG: methylglyoxal synthase [Chloroflexota bacterium]|nr:methylglyoxal synthase [Chloroflexota bacterium]
MERQSLALIAHDSKKDDMVRMAEAHREELSTLSLVATSGTGRLIHSRTGLHVTLVRSGPHGGDQQIGALVASGEIQAVVFLRDPLLAQPHEPDITALLRVCDVHNVPVATNLPTAEAVLRMLYGHERELNGAKLLAPSAN